MALDRLSNCIQPKNVDEPKHYESVKTLVEVAKASGVNFGLLCTNNIDIAMQSLYDAKDISHGGTFKDDKYHKLDEDERKMVEDKAAEICIATRFLSLSSDKLHSASKQEMKNDVVKGKNNYPTTIAGVIHFLQYHNLKRSSDNNYDKDNDNMLLAQEGKEEQDGQKKSRITAKEKPCRKSENGTCRYKIPHNWNECPDNPYGINKGKEVDEKGHLMCTVCTADEFTNVLDFDDGDLVFNDFVDDKLISDFMFYTTTSNTAYVFTQPAVEGRFTLSQTGQKKVIDYYWIVNPQWMCFVIGSFCTT